MALAAAFAGVLDLLSKRVAITAFGSGQRYEVIPGFVALTYIRNPRGAMGLFGDRPLLLVTLALAVVALLAFALRGIVRRSPLAQIGFGLVLGGAFGNVIDRLTHGFVVDLVAPRWFYVFNLADACITVGLALIALAALRLPARA